MSVPLKPRWQVPYPYGYGASIDSMGSISAPLLAATSTALVGLVLTLGDAIRWSNAALFLLIGSSFAFVSAVQLTFWARRFVVTPSELAEWWPERFESKDSELEWEQRFHYQRFLVWADRAKAAYNSGVLLLLASLPVMLIPKGPRLWDVNHVRLATAALAVAAFAVEAGWILLALRRPQLFDSVGSVA